MEQVWGTETIRVSDLVLAEHTGTRVFARSLKRISNGDDLLRALSRYIHFNSVFGSGVVNLAGVVGARQDLFRDLDEEVDIIADRSVEVAADIFFAAIDEFGGAGTRRSTHRSLAQATLRAVGLFFGHDPAALNNLARVNQATLAAIRRVRYGYGLDRSMDDRGIFRAIGFHLSSEMLASEEFRTLEESLHTNFPSLVEHLKRTEVVIDDSLHSAYRWIGIHGSVEAGHFDAAMEAAHRSIQFYAGSESRSRIKTWIIEGFTEFAEAQADFMMRLMEE